MKFRWNHMLAGLGALALTVSAGVQGATAHAAYPDHPIRVIVPFSPGGGVDVIARTISQPLGERLGQPLVIENRPGANGSIGVRAAVAAPADGYTLLFFATAAGMFPLMYSDLGYDPFKDFAPVSVVATQPLALFANPKFEASTVDDVVKMARDDPGALTYAGIGFGSPQHMAGELFSHRNGLQLTHVPYKGTAPAITDLISGQVQLGFLGLSSGMPYVESGQLKVLAVAAPERSALAPQVKTMAEEGYDDFNLGITYFLTAPAGTPQEVIDRLQAELKSVMADPKVKEGLMKQGYEAMFTTPQAVNDLMRQEHVKWKPVIESAGLKAN